MRLFKRNNSQTDVLPELDELVSHPLFEIGVLERANSYPDESHMYLSKSYDNESHRTLRAILEEIAASGIVHISCHNRDTVAQTEQQFRQSPHQKFTI